MARKYENVGNVKRLTQEEIAKLPEGKRKYFNITYTSKEGEQFEIINVYIPTEKEKSEMSKDTLRRLLVAEFLSTRYQKVISLTNLADDKKDEFGRFSFSCDKTSDTQKRTYTGTLANKTTPSEDTDLYRKWSKLVKYAKNNDLPIDDEIRGYVKFLQQATNIYNYEEWLHDENNYRLVVHKGADKVALNTILFVSEETWQNEYRKPSGGQSPKPVFAYVDLSRYGIYDKEGFPVILGFKCDSIDDCVQRTGLWQPSITYCLQGVMETTGAGVENPLEGWRFVDLSLFDITNINFNSNADKYKLIQEFKEITKE